MKLVSYTPKTILKNSRGLSRDFQRAVTADMFP